MWVTVGRWVMSRFVSDLANGARAISVPDISSDIAEVKDTSLVCFALITKHNLWV